MAKKKRKTLVGGISISKRAKVRLGELVKKEQGRKDVKGTVTERFPQVLRQLGPQSIREDIKGQKKKLKDLGVISGRKKKRRTRRA
jgi:hypothetical protein